MRPAAPPAGPRIRLFAWLGAVLFAASLLYLLYAYFVRFGRMDAPAGAPAAAVLINAGLFSVFALHHSALARTGAKRWLHGRFPEALERTLYVWLSSILFLGCCAYWQPVPGLVYALPDVLKPVGYSMQGAGVWLTLQAARALDLLDLAGVRQAVGGPAGAPLQARGAYGVVRHPIYLGWALLTFGAPVMTATRFSFACISTAYLIIAIPLEERSLVEEFGDAYRAYQRQVRWRMLPWLY